VLRHPAGQGIGVDGAERSGTAIHRSHSFGGRCCVGFRSSRIAAARQRTIRHAPLLSGCRGLVVACSKQPEWRRLYGRTLCFVPGHRPDAHQPFFDVSFTSVASGVD